MAVMIAHASSDERGRLSGGKAGDQTGREVCIRSWYNRPWSHVIRFASSLMREKVAYAMERAANNNLIGYNQNRRNTLLTYARKVKYDPGRVKTACETDCSALVSVACIYAGVPESALFKGGNLSTTANLRARLRATGDVTIYQGKEFAGSPDRLMRGDILLYESHHVAVVVKGAVSEKTDKSIEELAREVIDGKWGSGPERKKRLTDCGYNYNAVQAEVNRLLKL